MALKRKRSSSTFSTSSTCSTPSTTRQYFNQQSPPRAFTFAIPASPKMSLFSPASEVTETHLHSRTRKRLRDGRPSDEIVHQHTLSLLFNGAASTSATNSPALSPNDTSSRLAESMDSPEEEMADQLDTPTPAVPQTAVTRQPDTKQRSLHSFWKLPSRPIGATAITNCMDDEMMDVDMDAGSSSSVAAAAIVEKQWVGGLGWV